MPSAAAGIAELQLPAGKRKPAESAPQIAQQHLPYRAMKRSYVELNWQAVGVGRNREQFEAILEFFVSSEHRHCTWPQTPEACCVEHPATHERQGAKA
jgi:hypothetical protein